VVLKFRGGLELRLVDGGYGGFTSLFPEIFVWECYQPEPDFAIRDGWTVVDLGANMGFFTCKASSSARNVRVVAVEPVGCYADVLRENVRRNALQGVTIFQAAVSGSPGAEFKFKIWYTKSGEPMMTSRVPAEAARTEEVVAQALTLTEIFERGQVERCNFLKIDIEGAEYSLVEKTPEGIWSRVERIVMETHSSNPRDEAQLVSRFENVGFKVSNNRNMLWAIKHAAD
jgi:FkbM family methyltransferase